MAKTSCRGGSWNSTVFQHQPDAVLVQAAAVQNTWYTILNTTKNCRLIGVTIQMETANETIAVRITANNVSLTDDIVATAGTPYAANIQHNNVVGDSIILASGAVDAYFGAFIIEGTVKVEMRKTTAAGANVLKGRVMYATKN